jgi:hypothetical protein
LVLALHAHVQLSGRVPVTLVARPLQSAVLLHASRQLGYGPSYSGRLHTPQSPATVLE